MLLAPQAVDGAPTAKMWNVLLSVFGCCDNGPEKALLQAEVECGQAGVTFVSEFVKFGDLPDKPETTLNKLQTVTAAFERWVALSEKLTKLGNSKTISVTFRELLPIPHPGIKELISSAAKQLVNKITEVWDPLEELMAPAQNWKADLAADAAMDAVVAKAEDTLMTMKGKRVQAQTTALKQAPFTFIFFHFILFGQIDCSNSTQ